MGQHRQRVNVGIRRSVQPLLAHVEVLTSFEDPPFHFCSRTRSRCLNRFLCGLATAAGSATSIEQGVLSPED